MSVKRGEIYYVSKTAVIGSEQEAGRPAIIVSNNAQNDSSTVVEVVYLTTEQKKDLPTHVTIRSAPRQSIALCEQISSVSTTRIGNYIGEVTEREMTQIESALLISLDLWLPESGDSEYENDKASALDIPTEVVSEREPEPDMDAIREITKLAAERDIYRGLYERLLAKVMAG